MEKRLTRTKLRLGLTSPRFPVPGDGVTSEELRVLLTENEGAEAKRSHSGGKKRKSRREPETTEKSG